MDSLLITIKNDDGDEDKHWCLECHDGRFAKHEEDEKNAAKNAIIINSSDDDAIPGGDPGNSEYIDSTPQRQTKASHDKRSQDSGARDENMFCGIFGQSEDSLGNKRRLPTTGEKSERNDTDEETSGVSTDRLSANNITASADSRRGNYRRPSPNGKAKIEKPEMVKPKSKVQTKTKTPRSESPVIKGGTRPPRSGNTARAG